MYNLIGSFIEFSCSENPEEEHIKNIGHWFRENGLVKGGIEYEFQGCDGNEGYVYVYKDLVTFSETVNGMVEYKVWRKVR